MSAAILGAVAQSLKSGENARVWECPDGVCCLIRIDGSPHKVFLTEGEFRALTGWLKRQHAQMHAAQPQSNVHAYPGRANKSKVGLPILDMNMAEGKTNFYKLGSADYAMDEFKNNPFKVGGERASVMATYPDVFKMGYTRINPWRLGIEDINAFKMGGDSFALGASNLVDYIKSKVKSKTKGASPAVKAAAEKAGAKRAKQITGALNVVNAAQSGDPKAKATIAHVTKLASTGHPAAVKAHKDLKAAHKHLKAAKSGSAALPAAYATPERMALLHAQASKGGVFNTTLAQLFSAGLRAASL